MENTADKYVYVVMKDGFVAKVKKEDTTTFATSYQENDD